jgi:prepilin-type N-terminal cleavage/methylation domain-containing protein
MERARAGRPSGLTLVEILVTVAVVSFLAAVVGPLIAGRIEDAREARAANEVQVIAAAIAAFYKDVGHWPTMDATGAYTLTTLVSSDGTSDPVAAVAPGCARTHDPARPLDAMGWSSDTARPDVDDLRNHLLVNHPKGVAAYPSGGAGAWRGPYLETIPNDPWNAPYLVNVAATDKAAGIDKGFVLSAGPNGRVETVFAAGRSTPLGGDDIGAVFFVR